jgi:hypothetical protein
MSVVSAVCCQVEFAESGYHLSRIVLPTVMCMTKCDREISITGRTWPTRGCFALNKKQTISKGMFIAGSK